MSDLLTGGRLACSAKERSLAGISTTSGYSLPSDFTARAVYRLGWAAACYAGLFVSFYALHRIGAFASGQVTPNLRFYTGCMFAAAALGLGVAALAFSRRVAPCWMLDIGLVFEVVGAFLIAVTETAEPFQPGELIRGHSSLAIWVVFFQLLVPTTMRKAAVAAALTACMGPLALWVHVLFGAPTPTLTQWLLFSAAPFLMGGIAVAMSRYIYSLGTQVSKARELGSYEMIDLIGKGGMGEVWRARHRMLVRQAAVKLIRSETLASQSGGDLEAARRRFDREAQATASLRSPNTVTLYDYGVSDDGVFYYAMELLEGLDLDSLVNRFGPLPAHRAVAILEQVCDSLAEAHANGLTHRDIKPKNIFLCRLGLNHDFVKVLDFGLAKWQDPNAAEAGLTREGVTTGTPAFLSPELALGNLDADHRADIYAVGCVAYWLLTGQLVFNASTAMAMALAHVQSQPEPPSRRSEIEVPPELEQIVLACLEKSPDRRPQSAAKLKRMLSSTGLSRNWDAHQAEEWWLMHRPADVALPAAHEETMATI